ncbi:hypothetical protein CLU79DRAFT_583035 [Phycomyces nitens]|nr:hypothetical protein CLU79DRAFT_583035 [Phycomyces nitens]
MATPSSVHTGILDIFFSSAVFEQHSRRMRVLREKHLFLCSFKCYRLIMVSLSLCVCVCAILWTKLTFPYLYSLCNIKFILRILCPSSI